MATGRHLVLWDGECGFCGRCVDWAARRDADGLFEFAPYQEVPAPPMTPELLRLCPRAVQLIRSDGSRLAAGRAVLFVTERVGWPRLSRFLCRAPMIWAVEFGYAIVAANRRTFSRLLFRSDAESKDKRRLD
jgi:predicted DCC family thiol-disulfide oxidoreductase YuxK